MGKIVSATISGGRTLPMPSKPKPAGAKPKPMVTIRQATGGMQKPIATLRSRLGKKAFRSVAKRIKAKL